MLIRLTKKQGINLFKALGFLTANKWNAQQLQTKVNNLLELYSKLVKLDDEKMQARLIAVRKTLKAGKKIEIIDDTPPKAVKEVKKVKASEITTPMQNLKTGKAEKRKKEKKKKGVDKIGCRLGTQSAAINQVLLSSSEGASIEEIIKVTKLSAIRINNHIGIFIRKGIFEKTKTGYKIVDSKK